MAISAIDLETLFIYDLIHHTLFHVSVPFLQLVSIPVDWGLFLSESLKS